MAALDREQLEAFKRQIEEDYRLDLAAIERLQWRIVSTNGSLAKPAHGEPQSKTSRPLPALEPQAQQQPDDLANSLAGMFMSYRK